MSIRGEIQYYPEIIQFLSDQIVSNFRASYHKELQTYSAIGELRAGLQRIVRDHSISAPNILSFASTCPMLNLDAFILVTNGEQFVLVIIEVKLRASVGLNQWSQLVGYCIVTDAEFGLLVNVDGDVSARLSDLLTRDRGLSSIARLVNDSSAVRHELGAMRWNSITRNMEYSNLGSIASVSSLCRAIAERFF